MLGFLPLVLMMTICGAGYRARYVLISIGMSLPRTIQDFMLASASSQAAARAINDPDWLTQQLIHFFFSWLEAMAPWAVIPVAVLLILGVTGGTFFLALFPLTRTIRNYKRVRPILVRMQVIDGKPSPHRLVRWLGW